MEKRKFLGFLRLFTLSLSILCLFILFILFLRFIKTGISEKESIKPPVEVRHRVLFLSSYNSLYYTFDAQKSGLEKSLYSNGIEYDVLFMDSNSRGGGSFETFLGYLYLKKIPEKHYEAVLLGDDPALEFAVKYHDKVFPKTPMIFFGANNYELAKKAAQDPYITGLYENNYLEETIDLAMKLFPKRKTLVALHDQSDAGKIDFNTFWAFRDKYKNYAFVDLDTTVLTKNELIILLSELPKDSILFYMNCYSDKNGNIYSMLSRTSTVVNSAEVPVFRNYIGGEGMGILGGIHMDVEEQCVAAGEMVVKALRGYDISEIPFVEKTVSRTSIDYTLMKKFNLDFNNLPKDTVFYNRPETFLSHYGKILPSVIMLFITLVIFLVYSKIGKLISLTFINELEKTQKGLIDYQEQLRYQAEYDEVLDIYNRRTITEWLRNTMKKESIYSVVIIDIDDFKMLNENYGHSMADSILQYIVALLKGMVDEGGWKLARFGGDELIIIIPDEILNMDCQIVRQLFAAIRAPIPLGDETLAVTASMGASCSDKITPPEQHIINAETAMYEAKSRGKNGIVIYDDKMKEKALEEIRIKEKLQHAFDNDGFFMLYQPQIDTQSKEVSGYEALVRMKEPGIYPGQFIPVAERSGWIWRIGRITTELVIKQLAAWRDQGKKLHPVSVNFSSNQLNDHGYVDFVEELLKRYDIPPHYLEIEITEGLFLEKSVLADDIFKRFKEIGIRLLMDDFGTGYSSLGYLTYIPVDVIKLDKSLVDTYLVEGKDSFIRNIIHLMHDLDKDMIIEGVEEERQFNRLREFGADTIQGYYFSKPIPADEAINFKVN